MTHLTFAALPTTFPIMPSCASPQNTTSTSGSKRLVNSPSSPSVVYAVVMTIPSRAKACEHNCQYMLVSA